MRISDWSSDVCSSDLGIDVACTNDWQVRLLPSPTDDAVQYNAGIVTETTFNKPRHKVGLQSTHMGAKLTCAKAGRATLAQIALHYPEPPHAGCSSRPPLSPPRSTSPRHRTHAMK